MRHNRLSNNRGISMVFLAIILLVLLSMAALAIDLGKLYVAKQRAQNVADAAALAGAQTTPVLDGDHYEIDTTAAEAAAQECTAANNASFGHYESIDPGRPWPVLKPGTTTLGVIVSFPPSTVDEIQADAIVPVTFGFARVMGFETANVPARARVKMKWDEERKINYPFVPWCVATTEIWYPDGTPMLSPGQSRDLKVDFWDDKEVGAGNFGAIVLPGDDRGNPDYLGRIRGTNTDPVTITNPMYVTTEPGNRIAQTGDAIATRIGDDTYTFESWKATYDEKTGTFAETSRLVLVPIIDAEAGMNGLNEVMVVGFAVFFIEGYSESGTGQNKVTTVTGVFLQALSIDDVLHWDPFGNFPGSTPNLVKKYRPKLVE